MNDRNRQRTAGYTLELPFLPLQNIQTCQLLMLNKLDYISQWADNAANLSLVIHLENENSASIIHLRDLIYCFHLAFMANFKYLNQFSEYYTKIRFPEHYKTYIFGFP